MSGIKKRIAVIIQHVSSIFNCVYCLQLITEAYYAHYKECVYCDNDSILNLVHTKMFSVGKYIIISGIAH